MIKNIKDEKITVKLLLSEKLSLEKEAKKLGFNFKNSDRVNLSKYVREKLFLGQNSMVRFDGVDDLLKSLEKTRKIGVNLNTLVRFLMEVNYKNSDENSFGFNPQIEDEKSERFIEICHQLDEKLLLVFAQQRTLFLEMEKLEKEGFK